jgi:hypothetical protein
VTGRVRFVKVDATDLKAVAQARVLIRLLYKTGRRIPAFQVRKNVRFTELETLFAYYWRGVQLPDDDAGRDCLFVAACHLWHLGKRCGPNAAIKGWIVNWAPWCNEDEFAALISRVAADPRRWTADSMAIELGLPIAIRDALGLTTIGAIDLDKEGRKNRRRDRNRQKQAARRRKANIGPRDAYLENHSKRRTEPWQAFGISRSTYYRRRRETGVETTPWTAKDGETLVSTDLSQSQESRPCYPWTALGISRSTYYRRRARARQTQAPLPVLFHRGALNGETTGTTASLWLGRQLSTFEETADTRERDIPL